MICPKCYEKARDCECHEAKPKTFALGPLEQFSEQSNAKTYMQPGRTISDWRNSPKPSPLIGLLPLMKPLTPTTQLDDSRISELDVSIESTRSPCENCKQKAILSEADLCADCEHELTILNRLEHGDPLYILTDRLTFHPVLSIRSRPNTTLYEVTVPDISSSILVSLEDFYLDIPSLVTAGISLANDAILRFNHLHKQYLTLP